MNAPVAATSANRFAEFRISISLVAASEPMIPANTSPEPAVASQGVAVGTHDQTRGGFDDKIALFRAKAVKDFLLKLDGQLDFVKISQTVSTKREVRIACSN